MKNALTIAVLLVCLPLSCADGAGEPAPTDDGPPVTFGNASDQREAGSIVLQEGQLDTTDVVAVSLAEGFQSVGLRWDRLGAQTPALTVRTRASGQAWSEWQPVSITWNESVAYNGAFEPEGVAHDFELRGATGLTSFLAIELLPFERPELRNPKTLTTRTQGLAPASIVQPRSSWGATSGFCHLQNRPQTPRKITIHHTDTPTFDSVSFEARLRQIQDYHINNNGWCDIGYHFLISRDGRIWQGMRSETLRGIHVLNKNQDNVGVSYIGDFHIHQPPQAAIDAGSRIVRWLADTYSIQLSLGSTLLGHRDQNTTTCPGQFLYPRLGDIYAGAVAGAGSPPPSAGGEGLCKGVSSLSCGSCANPIDIEEDYLPGVVQCENGLAPAAALEAQAIAARSYLHYALEANGSIPDSQAGQVYSCGQTPSAKVRAAVQATRGQVLNNNLGQTIAAFYVAGAIPDPPLCVGDGDDPDAFNTEQWVTYQQIPGGGGPSPLGHPGNPKNRGCMSQNGAACLASSGADVDTILDAYYTGVSVVERAPACGGTLSPPPAASCPGGDGLYCGGPVGLDVDALYRCQSGTFAVVESCAAGCAVQAAGTPDVCADVGPSCPSGDGLYCGGPLELDANTVYSCTAGSFWPAESCSHGCEVSSSGNADACASAPPCPAGDGTYCGGPVGLNSAWLYDCVGGDYFLTEVCEHGCQASAAPASDACAPPPPVCPSGDGLYCGGGVGLDPATLYQCTAGAFTASQLCPHGCEVGAAGASCAPPPVPTCPTGDGFYCGGAVGLDTDTLYACTAGAFALSAVCTHGCESGACAPAPVPTCPLGNGIYCGGPVGLDAATLYACNNGSYTVVEACAHGCESMPTGVEDQCASAPPSCLNGNGTYCGTYVALTPGSLYNCVDGVLTLNAHCTHGCQQVPGTAAGACATEPAACPLGDGLYCGGPVGLDPSVLYTCAGGVFAVSESCTHGCQSMPNGVADQCAAAPTSSCPSGDGNYCGDGIGLDAKTLYSCVGGGFTYSAYCAAGCAKNPTGSDGCITGSCPIGNGFYCGSHANAGLPDEHVWLCTNGVWTVHENCNGACVVAPQGQPDYCP